MAHMGVLACSASESGEACVRPPRLPVVGGSRHILTGLTPIVCPPNFGKGAAIVLYGTTASIGVGEGARRLLSARHRKRVLPPQADTQPARKFRGG